MKTLIPYGHQSVSRADIDAVIKVLQSTYLTQGPVVPAFEQVVADRCQAQYAVAVNSATSALHIACLALDVGPGDTVWTSPITFVASANCARYCGAEVDFVDIDATSWCVSAERLREKLEVHRTRNLPLPKVVIPVHFGGQSCDMQAIYELGKHYGFKIIEDASHAIGGKYRGESIGNCQHSDITVFSFHPVKIVTTGEGGMALTNDVTLLEKMSLFRNHGITRDPHLMTHNPDGSWYYEQVNLGYNYRMTDFQAALGISQMDRLDAFVACRHKIVRTYNNEFSGLPLSTQQQHFDVYSACHLYVIRLKKDLVPISHKEFFDQLRKSGIGVNLHYIPVYRQPYYKQFGFQASDFPEAERYYEEAISLPIYPTLENEQQQHVIKTIKRILLASD